MLINFVRVSETTKKEVNNGEERNKKPRLFADYRQCAHNFIQSIEYNFVFEANRAVHFL